MTTMRGGHRRPTPQQAPAGERRHAQQPTRQAPASSGLTRLIRRADAAVKARPLFDYTMVRTIVLVLAGLGVVMVMSSSMATSFATSASVWAQALRQTVMVFGGLFVFWMMLKTTPERLRQFSLVIMGVAVLLLIIVLTPAGTGRDEVGSQSWLVLGPLSLQPSEFARVAIAIWGASILANRDYTRPSRMDNGFFPFIVVAALCVGLIGLQGDYGMAMSFSIVVGFILIFAGISWRLVGAAVAVALLGMAFIFFSGGFRSHRFHVYFDALFGRFEDTRGTAFQSHQGFLSLADGSLFGVGLGQSRAKWFYLPEARNDFIFAVIGEELGLWGGALVILLFGLLGYFGLRTARRARNQFQALLAAGLTAGVVSQAFINIAYVLGLLPVTGIQLPMLSAGGTSAVITLGAMGILASIARHELDAVSAIQNYGRPGFDRFFGIGEPQAPGQAVRGSQRSDRRPHARSAAAQRERFGAPVTARQRAQREPGARPATPPATRGAARAGFHPDTRAAGRADARTDARPDAGAGTRGRGRSRYDDRHDSSWPGTRRAS